MSLLEDMIKLEQKSYDGIKKKLWQVENSKKWKRIIASRIFSVLRVIEFFMCADSMSRMLRMYFFDNMVQSTNNKLASTVIIKCR